MQHCDQRCSFCAQAFWRWVKSREAQMKVPKKGETVSFAEAARTSVKP